MSILIAKKYVKAIVQGSKVDDLSLINTQLKEIALAYGDKKFNEIITSIDVETSKKVDLINSFTKDASNSLVNLIKLLAQNKRLNIIPNISSELNKEVSVITNSFTGVVYSSEALSDQYMSTIQENFAKKFNVELSLVNDVCDYDGIKVDIDGLGVEISFAKDRFKLDMINHILKAV